MTEEQQMLRDSAERYLRDNYDFQLRRQRAESGAYMDDTHWAAFAEMGWLALPFSEELGGFGFGITEVAVLAEQFGRYLVAEPLIDSAVIAGSLLTGKGITPDTQLIEQMTTGEAIVALAHQEPGAAAAIANVQTTATVDGESIRLTGHKVFITSGGVATHFVVTAKLDETFAYLLVPADAEGLHLTRYPSYDGASGANASFDCTLPKSALIAQGATALAAFAATREKAMLCSSAEVLGAMEAALEATVDYTKQRVQFGQPLSNFQALQHRMADMLIEVEMTRSLVEAACRAFDENQSDTLQLILAAKVKASTAARRITQEAIQLHGGIATTDEYIVGHYFKRVAVLESWLVTRDDALADFIATVDAA
jgi:hypothetical protein